MPAPSILIVASPYEAGLLARELADTGLRVLRADGGEGALALFATELPIAIVVGTSLMGADPGMIVAEARSRHEAIPLFLLADVEDPVAEELRGRVTAIFRRPTDFDALSHAIEKVAVDVESVDLAVVEEMILPATPPPPPVPLPRTATEHLAEAVLPEVPLVRAQRTEVLTEAEAGVVAMVATQNGNGDPHAASLLRADDALGGLAGLGLDEMTRPAPPRRARAFENRSTIAREIDRELSQAERRLFPNETSRATSLSGLEDYDDALSDIDLDALAIDTIPGLAQSLGIDEPRARAAAASPSAPEPPLLRPVQEEGALEEIDVAELLARLHGNAFSGALQISLREGDKVLYLDQGEPVGARSTLRHDQLGELLFREGKLSREQAVAVRGESPDGAARPIALKLVAQGLLKEREIFGAMRRHAEEVLYSLFALEGGRYQLGPALPGAEDRVRLSSPTAALLLEGVRRKYGLERLSARVDRAQVLRPTTAFSRVLETAGLTPEERRVAAMLDGTRTLAEVRAALGRTPESVILALAWVLRITGAVDAGDGHGELRYASTVVTDEEVAERRARPRLDDPAQQAAEEAVERERIASKRAQIANASYFSILGVRPDASPHEIRRAHERLRADFDPLRFGPAIAAEQREALEEIAEVLDEALRVLSSGLRERYAEHLLPDEPEG